MAEGVRDLGVGEVPAVGQDHAAEDFDPGFDHARVSVDVAIRWATPRG